MLLRFSYGCGEISSLTSKDCVFESFKRSIFDFKKLGITNHQLLVSRLFRKKSTKKSTSKKGCCPSFFFRVPFENIWSPFLPLFLEGRIKHQFPKHLFMLKINRLPFFSIRPFSDNMGVFSPFFFFCDISIEPTGESFFQISLPIDPKNRNCQNMLLDKLN